MARLAEKLGDLPRAMQEYRALLDHDHTAVEPARRLAALAEKAGDEATLQLAWDRVVALDPFDAAAHSRLGAARAEAPRLGGGDARVQGGAADHVADKAAAHCDLGEAYLLAGRPRGRQEGSAGGARNRADLRAGAGPASSTRSRESDVRAAGDAWLLAAVAGLGLLAAGALTLAATPSRPPAPDARFAGLQWTFARDPLRRVDACRRAARFDIYDEPWYDRLSGRRAEPVAPRPHRHRDPGQRSGRHHARGSRASGTTPGSTSSSRATCG